MGYAMPNSTQPRATLRFKAVHNKRDNIQLNVALIDSQNKRHVMDTHAMFQYSGSVPLGGPGEDSKDFEWGLDLTRLAEQSNNSVEQVLKDLHLGKAKLEVSFSSRQNERKKRKKKRTKVRSR